jgi:hypothetical protein
MLVALLLMLPACRKDCWHQTQLELEAPYTTYFDQLTRAGSSSDGRVVTARSSTGLTDSYLNVQVRQEGFTPEQRGCEAYLSSGRSVYYNPSLYRRSFRVSVVPYPDAPRLIVQEQFGSLTGQTADSEIFYDLSNQLPNYVRYYDPAKYSYQYYDVPPQVQSLPTLTVGGRTYTDVLRLTNPYAVQRGNATTGVVYYITRDYGLVRFEQRDGTVWDLTP